MQVFRMIGVALAMSVALLTGSPTQAAVPADCQNVATGQGPVNGVVDADHGLCVYKGIPYAAPPVKQLRFQKARPHDPWTEPLQADDFDEGCPRYPIAFPPKLQPDGDEDCLTLNIWHQNKGDAPKPVMVWIHGGGFVTGTASTDFYDGTELARQGDVVVVTVNYRLGFFGFNPHQALVGMENGGTNLGLRDQVFALQWVKDNIAAFGGDPDNVTIFGESAGGISVAALLASPLTMGKGLFHKAIIQSGPLFLFNEDLQKAQVWADKAAQQLGCTDPDGVQMCLRKVGSKTALRKAPPGFRMGAPPTPGIESFRFGPVIDGEVLPGNPYTLFKEGKWDQSIPVITGTTAEEMSLFMLGKTVSSREEMLELVDENADIIREFLDVDMKAFLEHYDFDAYPTPNDAAIAVATDIAFTCPVRIHARQMLAGKAPVYLYEHAQAPAAGMEGMFAQLGAFHGSDIPYVFGVFKFMGFDVESDVNRVLSDKVIGLWTSFARTGKPEAQGMPAWPAFTQGGGRLVFQEKPELRPTPTAPQCGMVEELIAKAAGG